MTTNSTTTKDHNLPLIVSNPSFLSELTTSQKDLLINLLECNRRVNITYSNNNEIMRVILITTKGTPASKTTFFKKPRKLTVSSLIKKGLLVLENEKLRNNYYVRIYRPNGEIEL